MVKKTKLKNISKLYYDDKLNDETLNKLNEIVFNDLNEKLNKIFIEYVPLNIIDVLLMGNDTTGLCENIIDNINDNIDYLVNDIIQLINDNKNMGVEYETK